MWAKYRSDCRKAGQVPSQHPKWEPVPLPGNRVAFRAFLHIKHCRTYTFGGAAGFDWCAVAERLRLHGLWTPEVERKLTTCEETMLLVESEVREREKTEKAK